MLSLLRVGFLFSVCWKYSNAVTAFSAEVAYQEAFGFEISSTRWIDNRNKWAEGAINFHSSCSSFVLSKNS